MQRKQENAAGGTKRKVGAEKAVPKDAAVAKALSGYWFFTRERTKAIKGVTPNTSVRVPPPAE